MIRKRVLIVDDDVRNIFALSAVLKAKSFDCLSSLSGVEAIKLLQTNAHIDYILMDMMMPEMDGYEAMSQIKNMPHRKTTPLIAVTAQAMVGDREKCLEAGADDYISKPIDVDKLLQVLSTTSRR